MKKISLIILLVLVVGFVALRLGERGIENSAKRVVRGCLFKENKAACYDTEIPKLMKYMSMEDAFSVVAEVQNRDPSLAYCHVLGHKLAAIETKKNPDLWKSVIGRCPGGVCSNGCVHGAFQERFRTEYFTDNDLKGAKDELKDICEPREGFTPSGLEKSSCYHALGHLYMYITNADIKKSVAMCDDASLVAEGYRGVCYDGAFMQIYQPLDPDDFALIKGKEMEKDRVSSFCSEFMGEARNSCLSESWPLFFDEITTPEGLLKFCGSFPPNGKDECFNDMFYILPIQFKFDLNYISDFCGKMGEYSERCYTSTASRILEIDKKNKKMAVDFCQSVPDPDRNACLDHLVEISDFVFIKGSGDHSDLCNIMPGTWREKCLNKN